MKKHKGLKIALIAVAAVLVVVLAAAWSMFGTQLTAANTIQKLDEGLWSMEYRGDYGFDKFLAQGGAASDAEMGDYIAAFLSHGFWKPDTSTAGGDYGCSALMVNSPEGGMLFGRNYDWGDCKAMVVCTVPRNGYASVSTCCLDFLGFGEDWVPDGSMADQFMALAAVYVPLDGMNEKGLCVADLMVEPGEVVHQDTDKPDLTVTAALRMLLDYTAEVDEALAMLRHYDMNFSLESAHHFAISDATGRSVVVEWIGGEMVVTETNVVTNHYVAQRDGLPEGFEASHLRFDTLAGLRESHDGVMTGDEVMDAMQAAASSNFNYLREDHENRRTQWTLVFDQDALTARFCRLEDWDRPYLLDLMNDSWLQIGQSPSELGR